MFSWFKKMKQKTEYDFSLIPNTIKAIKELGYNVLSGYHPPADRHNHFVKVSRGEWEHELSIDNIPDNAEGQAQTQAMYTEALAICKAHLEQSRMLPPQIP